MTYYNPDPELKAREKRGGLLGALIGAVGGMVAAVLQLNALEDAWDWTSIFPIVISALVFGTLGWVIGMLVARNRVYKARVEGRMPMPKPVLPPEGPARDLFPATPIQAMRCVVCGKGLQERTVEAIFSPALNISDSTTYPCKSCGVIYCLDCMSHLKTSGKTLCLRCGQPHGW